MVRYRELMTTRLVTHIGVSTVLSYVLLFRIDKMYSVIKTEAQSSSHIYAVRAKTESTRWKSAFVAIF